ncbi:MAG: transcription termination/antitermination protein NusG [Helicobacter sp.]|nr:transcription termination/antitermination protein NusG [Helicobacter sp.]
MSLDWYAIQTYSGSEQSVEKSIKSLLDYSNIEARIIVPTEDVFEYKGGKKIIKQRSIYPGYVFIYVDLTTALWHMIQALPKVSKFIGEDKKPTPLSQKDIDLILEKIERRADPKPKIFFSKGEMVRIINGPFVNFTAIVEEYDVEHEKLKLNVSIFGRNTPIEILYSQVEKIV